MSTITTIQPTDIVASSRAVINANFDALNTDKVESLADLGITVPAADINTVVTRNLIMPSGVIMLWATATAPTGWRICNGDEISRATFADLFAVIGTTYGSGNGTTTFNLPNLRGRVPVGLDSAQTEFDTLGETGGAKTHTLTAAQIPPHNHELPQDGGGGSTRILSSTGSRFPLLNSNLVSANDGGGGEAHNNLQPYITLHYIIKL